MQRPGSEEARARRARGVHGPAGVRQEVPGDPPERARLGEGRRGERSPGRTNSRNGYRERGLLTPAGDIRVRIPKLRTGTFFPEDLIERYCRADRALVAAVAEMYVLGISTRKVEEVAGALGVSSMSPRDDPAPRLPDRSDR